MRSAYDEPGWCPGLVALDIDGTLVSPDERVSPAVAEAVRRVLDAGVHVVLSTGRSVHATRPVAATLGLTEGWLVCSNGAVTATIDPPVVVETVTFDAAPAVRLLRQHLPDALVAVEELGVGYRVSAPFPAGELAGEQVLMDVDELVRDPVTRVVLRSPEKEPGDFLDVVGRLGLHDVSYAVGYTAWLDLAPDGVTKAYALEPVRERLGVPADRTLAIGDGRNDLEMLQWAACGVAMGHAPAEVQDAADVVTGTFDDDGAARALERWFA
ncbi:HAD family hydrolase [Motilibacter aurantiacus]|uniref:HAD family hydrolase n=1 Tax=Motilibacter aurantiacus TaxID=2714955 RepID=UPI00140B3F58|nr:HAD family hydrolase [Motilibacter aurantiacus]NHC46318.1 HAD family phosphatase [Motilibacter aurantiacus]